MHIRYSLGTAIAVMTVSVLSGCAISPQQMSSKSDTDICQSYGVFRSGIGWGAMAQSYKEEILRRKLLSDEDMALVEQKKLRLGMSKCAMYASWGRPDRENRTVHANGVHIQHIFNAGYKYIRPTYVYTDGDTVTAWQD